jgi:hypothetical protein
MGWPRGARGARGTRGTGCTRRRNDDGGVWIATGIVCGILLYGFIVLMAVAGFTAVAPLVVVPPVLLALIGANSLLGGPRRPSPPPRPIADGPGRPSSPGTNGTVAEDPPGPG